mgnify:CR=1 FL=1|tara:strand:+ start:3277 stop:3564 length:288 start_codon:yes stop_codon:yes gene_type:complete
MTMTSKQIHKLGKKIGLLDTAKKEAQTNRDNIQERVLFLENQLADTQQLAADRQADISEALAELSGAIEIVNLFDELKKGAEKEEKDEKAKDKAK